MFFTHRERERGGEREREGGGERERVIGRKERERETYQLPSFTPLPPLGVEGLLQVVYPQLQAEIIFS